MGIGTAFTRDLFEFLKNKGYKQTPLSAQKTNYAVRMYRKQVLRLLMKMKKLSPQEMAYTYATEADILKMRNRSDMIK